MPKNWLVPIAGQRRRAGYAKRPMRTPNEVFAGNVFGSLNVESEIACFRVDSSVQRSGLAYADLALDHLDDVGLLLDGWGEAGHGRDTRLSG